LLKNSYLLVENRHLFGGVFSTPHHAYMAAFMSGFKYGRQVIVPVPLEFIAVGETINA
jgi:hypothetical protein